jgi:hypothetical protein
MEEKRCRSLKRVNKYGADWVQSFQSHGRVTVSPFDLPGVSHKRSRTRGLSS